MKDVFEKHPLPWATRDGYLTDAGGDLIHGPGARAEIVHRVNTYSDLYEALKWYVENDEVNEDDPDNQFWVDGLNRARAALKKAEERL